MTNLTNNNECYGDETIAKARSLYEYLLKFAKLRQNVTVNLSSSIHNKAIDEFPEDHSNITINYFDTVSASANDEQEGDDIPLCIIHKPEFERCPPLPAELNGWIANGWDSFSSKAVYFPGKYKSSGLPVLEEIGDETDIEFFDDSPRRKKAWEKWNNKRVDWVNQQKAIDKTRRLFELFYNFHMEMQRDSENLELVIANGFFESQARADVKYPILSKKVKTEFDARNNCIYVYDQNSAPELYTDVFEIFDEMRLEHLSELKDSLTKNAFHPLDRNDTPLFLKEVLNTLTTEGLYFEKEPDIGWKANYKYICYWKPVYLLRTRQDGSVRIIEKIIENINKTGYIPPHIAEIIAPGKVEKSKTVTETEESDIEKLASIGGESSEVMLTKEANREQLYIAKRIEHNNAVVVQGPPGTGKTHTIANLLGHFLAQGKSVLVTSFTPKALKVLKDKVAKEIQPLCVSVIDDDKAEMMRSVNGITDAMSKNTSDKLYEQVCSLKATRKTVLSNLGNLRKKLFSIRHQECQTITYSGESLSPSDIADYVAKNENTLNYIPGNIVERDSLPLSLDLLSTLCRTNDEISEKEYDELALDLPNPETLVLPKEFEDMVVLLNRIDNKIKDISIETGWTFSFFDNTQSICVSIDSNRTFHIPMPNASTLAELFCISERFKDLDPWMKYAAIDGKGLGIAKQKWDVLCSKITDCAKLSEQLDLDSFGKNFSLPTLDEKEHVVFLRAISSMFAIRQQGATIGKTKLLFHPSWKKALSIVSVNGKTLSEAEDFKIVLDGFALKEKRKDCARCWDQLIQKTGAKGFFELDAERPEVIAKNFVNEIKKYTEWYQTDYEPLNRVLLSLSINPEVLFGFNRFDSELQRTNKIFYTVFSYIKPFVEICKLFIQKQDIISSLSQLRNELSKNERYRSIQCSDLCNAIKNHDSKAYSEAYIQLKELYEKYDIKKRREELLEALSRYAPKWADAIRSRSGLHGNRNLPENIIDAWRWKRYSAILEDLLKEDYDKLQKKITGVAAECRKVTSDFVAASAWFHLIKRTETDHGLKASLTGWAKTVQSIGRTNTHRSVVMRQQARNLMAKCQSAVPAWIMPISKAMSSLDPINNKFDVIIVDEASQADITTLAIAYMAKKIIIVGDDKQVTPLAVGTQFDQVNALIEEHLKGRIENSHLYNERSSIYDIAGTTYATMMLKEHFRCVPEIIGFSNMLSYDNSIKPLRDPTTSILLPHVVNYRCNGTRKGDVNECEAKTIVALIKACLEQKEYDGKSFGVISMLAHEQHLMIQKMISERICPRDIEERHILCGEPSNFQGDERDVVFMSIVDSKDDSGPLTCMRADANMNLWRKRYNVAASRPKDQLWVIHSLDITSDLKPDDIRKTLIDYAQAPASFISAIRSVEERTESPFEKEVADKLLSLGYHIEPQYTVGAYRIDFVVIYKDNKVAFECDGERYHSSEEDVRADMERQQILERLGWRFVRLRGCEYYRNKEQAIERVVADFKDFGILPEDWNDSIKSAPRSSELLERVKLRANEILEEWNDESKAENTLKTSTLDEKKAKSRNTRKTKNDQTVVVTKEALDYLNRWLNEESEK